MFAKGLHRSARPSVACHRKVSFCRAASADNAPFVIPMGPNETVEQAQACVLDAWRQGVKRQRLELLLPLIGATDLDDWPGGVRQQFKAALPMVETLMRKLKTEPGLEGPVRGEIWDDADAVGAWESEKILCVVFPTADSLDRIQKAADKKELVLLINPQWQGGQVISDFGLFWGRQRKEDFVRSFADTYCLKALRMSGENLRILSKAGKVQLFVQEIRANQQPRMVFVQEFEKLPPYFELEKLLIARPGSIASMSLVERMQSEIAFNKESLKQ